MSRNFAILLLLTICVVISLPCYATEGRIADVEIQEPDAGAWDFTDGRETHAGPFFMPGGFKVHAGPYFMPGGFKVHVGPFFMPGGLKAHVGPFFMPGGLANDIERRRE